MQLTVKQAAQLLNMSEKKLYRLIKDESIPSYHINRAYLINKSDLLEWAINNNQKVSPEIFSEGVDASKQCLPNISEALSEKNIYYNLKGNSIASVIEAIVQCIDDISTNEKQQIITALMQREHLGSTAIGNGIAIPHVRNPIILNINRPMVFLSFFDEPIDFGALDHKRVSIFFTLLSTTTRIHLHLLAQLSFILQQEFVLNALQNRLQPNDLINAIITAEKLTKRYDEK